MISSLALHEISTAKKETLNAVFTISFIIAVFLLYDGVLFSHRIGGVDIPMLTVGGRYLREDRIHCFAPLDDIMMKRIREHWQGKAVLCPFAYYNLQFMNVNVALDTLYLSVLVVPDEFLGTRIKRYLARGRFPDPSALECVAGSDAARAWRIREGEFFELELEKKLRLTKVEEGQPRERALQVVGVMKDTLNFQFLRGAILLTRSTFEALYGRPPRYNCFFAYAAHCWSPITGLRHQARENELSVFRVRYPLLRSGPPALMVVVLLGAVGMAFQLNASSSLARSRKNVGIFVSLGMDRWRVSLIFALADGFAQALGVAAGFLMARYVFLLMNLAVMYQGSSILSTHATQFRFRWPSLGVLIVVLWLSAVLRAGRTVRILSRTSPNDLLRGAET
jgi:hypothetical protein